MKDMPQHPSSVDISALLQQAVLLQRQNRLHEAVNLYQATLNLNPRHPDALHLLGVAQTQLNTPEAGAACIRKSLAINASQPAAWANLGNAEMKLLRIEEALRCYERALSLAPGFVMALNGRGKALLALDRPAEALLSFEHAQKLDPQFLPAIGNRGEALLKLDRLQEAISALNTAISLQPDKEQLLMSRGIAQLRLARYPEALADAGRALELNPDNDEACLLCCAALKAAGAFKPLLELTRRALTSHLGSARYEYFHATALEGLGREEDAIVAYEQSLRHDPNHGDSLFELGILCLRMRRFKRAVQVFDRLLEIDPDRDYLLGTRLHARMQICDWRDYEAEVTAVVTAVSLGQKADLPLTFMAISDDPALLLTCTRTFVAANVDQPPTLPPMPVSAPSGARLRIAYVSGDFLEHPVAYLLAGVIEAHDRQRFEITGISLRTREDSPTFRRLRAAFDRFVDASALSDEDIARHLRDLGADIVIDLMGYTAGARPGILARRPAPTQIGFLGYPGTLCVPYIDYLIADSVTIPPSAERHYAEQIIRLPGCYLPNDSRRPIGAIPSRAQAGLPESGLIFGAFTLAYKINPPVLAIWASLLQAVPGSVLWLRSSGGETQDGLLREAASLGIAADRVVFAEHSPDIADHLARLSLTDLCLDTYPYNSHSTCCDALWAGVPVLTCAGRGMASRVAASVLLAVGLDDFVTESLDHYSARALDLASNPWKLRQARERLRNLRNQSALFDTVGYTRALEREFLRFTQAHRGSAQA